MGEHKFCVGDIVIAIDDHYAITNKKGHCIAKIISYENFGYVNVEILYHDRHGHIGSVLPAHERNFEILKDSLFI